MSYDLEVGVKVYGMTDKYIGVEQPQYDHPTYNLGVMFRKAMDWDFEPKEWYCVADVIENINKGIGELRCFSEKYRKYEPENGWGHVETALEALVSLRDCIAEVHDYDDLPYDKMYMRW